MKGAPTFTLPFTRVLALGLIIAFAGVTLAAPGSMYANLEVTPTAGNGKVTSFRPATTDGYWPGS